jgi:DNA-binding PadR family transcriptional regulator
LAGGRDEKGGGWRRGFLGYYALSVIEREPIYAYQLAAMISERTQGTWQPSPGAVYPALRSLAARGLIRSAQVEGQRSFRITPAGRRRLAAIRRERRQWSERFGNVWRLTLDVVEPRDRAAMGLRRLRSALELVESLGLGEEELVPAESRAQLRREVLKELASARKRWTSAPPRRASSGGAE